MRRAFPGGLRWPSGGFPYHKRIEPLPRPQDLAVPLWHGGRAEVQPGDRVKPYLLIGYDREGLPVHAPLGGKVSEVGEFPHLLARPKQFDFPRLTVFIDVDRKQSEAALPYRPLPRFWELTHQELCRRLLEAGVMDVCHRDLPRMVIHNALDLEPPLAASLRLLEERTAEVLEGMRIINQLHGAVRSRIALASGFPGLEARLRMMLASSVNLSLHVMEPVYPQGHRTLLKKEIFPGDRCSIYDMTDALRVREAVVLGRPVVESHLTVRNCPVDLCRNVTAPVGTPAGHALWSSGDEARPWRNANPEGRDPPPKLSLPDQAGTLSLIFGGLLSGRGYYSLEMPVQADTRGLLLVEQKRSGPAPCLNCGACHARCPSGLHPSEIRRQVSRLDTKRLAELGLDSCLDCGLCSWVCPSKIELFQQIEVGRMLLGGRL
jgi:electron transport complex protein RnfC